MADAECAVVHRLMRRAGSEAYAVLRASTETHRRLRDRILVVLIATVGIDLICAVIAYFAEHHTKGTDIKSFGSALFWTSTQLLTVSSSIKNPLSTSGRVLDVVMEFYAITVVATLAGSFGAFFQKRGIELDRA